MLGAQIFSTASAICASFTTTSTTTITGASTYTTENPTGRTGRASSNPARKRSSTETSQPSTSRKTKRNGENLQELIREQPAGIQQLILPPLNATQQTTQREQTALAPAITQQLTPPQRHAIDLQYITETHQPIRNNNSTMNAQKRSTFLRIQQLRQHFNT
ncbi:hypothetical protein ACLKA6_010416 [Drosophila palustris]